MTREEKLMKVHALLAEVFTALKDGKPPDQIPNYYSVLENFSPDQHWD